MVSVSVLLPVWNGESLLTYCLESVGHQTVQDFEIIAVDDGSTDRTLAKLHAYEYKLPIHIFSSGFDWRNKPVHVGLARSCNVAVSMAKGDYLAFIGHDDLWVPNKLERELEAIKESNADVVYSDFMLQVENGERRPIHIAEFDSKRLRKECYINASSALISKMAVQRLGRKPFDETLHSAMDWDFWIRLSAFATFHHLPEVLSVYTRHSRQLSRGFNHRLQELRVYTRYNGVSPSYLYRTLIWPYAYRALHYPIRFLEKKGFA